MNDLQKELQELKAKVANLESRIVAEPVKWQPKGGNWWISKSGKVQMFYHGSTSSMKEFGMERQTEEQERVKESETKTARRDTATQADAPSDGRTGGT